MTSLIIKRAQFRIVRSIDQKMYYSKTRDRISATEIDLASTGSGTKSLSSLGQKHVLRIGMSLQCLSNYGIILAAGSCGAERVLFAEWRVGRTYVRISLPHVLKQKPDISAEIFLSRIAIGIHKREIEYLLLWDFVTRFEICQTFQLKIDETCRLAAKRSLSYQVAINHNHGHIRINRDSHQNTDGAPVNWIESLRGWGRY